jgi:hypothetical protein
MARDDGDREWRLGNDCPESFRGADSCLVDFDQPLRRAHAGEDFSGRAVGRMRASVLKWSLA